MTNERLFAMPFSDLYPLYLAKVERKGRSRAELDAVLAWYTGFSPAAVAEHIARGTDLRTFFALSPDAAKKTPFVSGTVCGVRVQDVTDPTLRMIRALDLLIDELARGKQLTRILRS